MRQGKEMNRGLAAVLFIALLAVAAAVDAAQDTALRSGVFKPSRPAPDFSLRGSDGAELKLSRYRGKVVALGFGFTSCPEVCPTTLTRLARAQEKFGAVNRKFQVIYVTVDPQRDSPERLHKYLTAFDPSFVGGTGTPEQLAQVRAAYGVFATKQSLGGNSSEYSVHHSSSIYLIDPQGNLRAMMPYGGTPDDLVHDVRVLLEN